LAYTKEIGINWGFQVLKIEFNWETDKEDGKRWTTRLGPQYMKDIKRPFG